MIFWSCFIYQFCGKQIVYIFNQPDPIGQVDSKSHTAVFCVSDICSQPCKCNLRQLKEEAFILYLRLARYVFHCNFSVLSLSCKLLYSLLELSKSLKLGIDLNLRKVNTDKLKWLSDFLRSLKLSIRISLSEFNVWSWPYKLTVQGDLNCAKLNRINSYYFLHSN